MVLKPEFVEESHEALSGADDGSESGGDFLTQVLVRCMRCNLVDLFEEGTQIGKLRPAGTSESAWQAFLEECLTPQVRRLQQRAAWEARLKAAGIQNLGRPLRELIRASMQAGSAACSPVRKRQSGNAQARTDAELSAVHERFGWLHEAGEWLLTGNFSQCWFLQVMLRQAGAPSEPLPADSVPPRWTRGCWPVMHGSSIVAVVLSLPWIEGMFPGIDTSNARTVFVGQENLRIRGVPIAHGRLRHEALHKGSEHVVKFIEFVVTPDRARFLVDSMATARQQGPGTMLGAPSGYGKSMCCLALAIINTIGAGGDVLALPKADLLAGGVTAAELCDSLVAPMLRLSCGPALEDAKLHTHLHNICQGQDAETAMCKLFDAETGFLRQSTRSPDPVTRLIILDNVQDLHYKLAKQNQESLSPRWSMAKALLSEKNSAGTVLAYGPDVQGLAPLESSDTATSSEAAAEAGEKRIVVRLEGFSTSEALALTLRAPDAQPVVDAATAAGEACDQDAQGLGEPVPFLQLPQAVHTLATRSEVSQQCLSAFVERTGGSVAALQSALVALNAGQVQDHGKLHETLVHSLQDWFTRERCWLQERIRHSLGPDKRDSLEEQLKCAKELLASTQGGSESTSIFPRCALEHVQRAALAFLGVINEREHFANKDTPGARVLQLSPAAASIPEVVEKQVVALVHMGLLGRNFIPMSSAAGPPPTHLLSNGQLSTEWAAPQSAASSAVQEKLHFTQALIAKVHTLKPGEKLVIHTSHSFPRLDCLTIVRNGIADAYHLECSIEEVTVGRLSVHPKRKEVDFLQGEGLPDGTLPVAPTGAAKDLALLIADKKWYWEETGDGSVLLKCIIKSNPSTGPRPEECTSFATAALQGLGLPVVVNGFMRQGDDGRQVLSMKVEPPPEDVAAELRRRVGEALPQASDEEQSGRLAFSGDGFGLYFVYCSLAGDSVRDAEPAQRQTDVQGYFALVGPDCMARSTSSLLPDGTAAAAAAAAQPGSHRASEGRESDEDE